MLLHEGSKHERIFREYEGTCMGTSSGSRGIIRFCYEKYEV